MKSTEIYPACETDNLRRAALILRQGGVVAFPTETYYGLAVDPLQEQALWRLFRLKKRSTDKAVLVLTVGMDQIMLLARDFPQAYLPLAVRFWPGPLSLVCPARPGLSPLLTGNRADIGLRYSSSEVANRLIAAFGGPITATSANLSGQPAAVSSAEVADIFGDQVDMILDGGNCPGGQGSTLVGLDEAGGLACIREGKIPFDQILAAIKQ